MRAVECTLISTTLTNNQIGVQEETKTQIVIPLIRVEEVYSNEFYQAYAEGFRPELRLRVSAYSYNYEKELIYNGTEYTVIRTQNDNPDEIILVCERKVRNV